MNQNLRFILLLFVYFVILFLTINLSYEQGYYDGLTVFCSGENLVEYSDGSVGCELASGNNLTFGGDFVVLS